MLQAEARKSRSITKVERVEDALVMHSEYGLLEITPRSESIMRVRYTCEEGFPDDAGAGICYDSAYSEWHVEQSEKLILLHTSTLTLEISRETASIRYYDRNGRLLLAERDRESKILDAFDSYTLSAEGQVKMESIETPDGVKRVIREADKVFDKKLYHTQLYLDWQSGEELFGLGQHPEGTLSLRGTTQYLHQANMKITIPFLLSTNGYGILFSTGGTAIFNDTAYGSYVYTEADACMDFYFIAGDSFDALIKGFRLLSGKAAMLPKWAFGYLQCQERYETAEELIDTVKEYRRRNIGLDCIILDWMSWKDGLWGQKTFDEERFPDPKKMIDEIHGLNARLMISIWPVMNEAGENYKEFANNKLLLPMSNFYDAFNPVARKMYWDQANRGLFTYGIDAWWCDNNEPITPEWTCQEKPEPSALYYEYVKETSNSIPVEKCNAYGLVHAQGVYEGQRSTGSEKRVVNLTRSGYTGSQRYGTILWSGDTSASWDTLKKQIAAGLNFCASGLPYWTLDIGGFFVKQGKPWYWSGEYEAGNSDLGYRELYTRWFQFGAFLPIFRTHGTDVRREVWAFGEEGEMFYDALVGAIRLRYRLMPYIYSLAGSCWHEDGTMMRMLAFDFPNDPKALAIKDQFMFGQSIMVCPVTQPMYYTAGSKPVTCADYTRPVYLPSGTRWIDFWTNQVYEGGNEIHAAADISKIPLFIREGSILPTVKPITFSDETRDQEIELNIYPGRDCSLMFYSDDGDGYGYENGEYSLAQIQWNDSTREITYKSIHGTEKNRFAVSVLPLTL